MVISVVQNCITETITCIATYNSFTTIRFSRTPWKRDWKLSCVCTAYEYKPFHYVTARIVFRSKIRTGLKLGLSPANERRRYKVTPSLIGWTQT